MSKSPIDPRIFLSESEFNRGRALNKQNEGLPIVGNGWLGNLAGGFGSSFFSSLGDAARFVGLNNAADVLQRGGDYFEERLKPAIPAEFSWNYLTSPEGIARGTGNLTGSIASIAAPTAFVPGGAFATGAKFLSKLPMLGRAGEGFWKMGLRGGVTAPMEAAMEGGNYIRNAIANGEDPETARQKANEVFGKNLGFLTASNALQWGLASKILNGTGWKSRLAAAAVEPPIQAAEEFGQQGIQNAAEGKPYTYNPFEMFEPKYESQRQAALEGGLPTALLSSLGFAGGTAYNSMFKDKNKTSQEKNSGEKIESSPTETPANDDNLISWAKDKVGGDERVIKKIIAEAKAQGVDPREVLAIGKIESDLGLNTSTSGAGAIGVMQLMPETAKELGFDPYNEDENIRAGIAYYKKQREKFGNPILAAAAYNAGSGTVQEYGGVPPYRETEKYAEKMQSILDSSSEYSTQNSQTQNIYTGENGKAEGKYWNRQTDNVSIEGLQPQGLNAIDMLGKWFYEKTGKPLILTSGTDGTSHTDGEHSHYDGWKFDVNDWDGNSDGYLVTADGSKGTLTDEFIEYGRSLGLGMNWERDHIDVALDGKQWDGNGENAGGFNPANIQSANKNQTPPPNETASSENPTAANNEFYDRILSDLLKENDKPRFNLDAEDGLTKNIYKQFAEEKKSSATGEDLAQAPDFFKNLFDEDGKFKNTAENRKAVAKTFGDEFITFAQDKLNDKIADYKNFLQTKTSPLAEEVEKLTSHLQNLQRDYDSHRNFETPDENTLASLQDEIFKSSNERDRKLSLLDEMQKILYGGSSQTETTPTEKPKFTLREGAKENKSDKFLISLLEKNLEPQFNPNDDLMKNIVAQFAYNKSKDSANQEFFRGMFKRNGEKSQFQNTAQNRQKIIDKFGDELQSFGQAELDRRIENFNKRYTNSMTAQSQPQMTTLQTYQSELANLQNQIKTEQKNLSKAVESRDAAAVTGTMNNIRTLQQQLSDKNTELENFKTTPEYMQERTAELENLKLIRDNLSGMISTGNEDKNLTKYHNDVSKQIAGIENELQGIQQPVNQPTLQTYQSELNTLQNQIATEQKKLSKAIGAGDKAEVTNLTANIKALQQQLTDKNAELESFKKTPEYIQSRTAELEDLKSMRDSLGEIISTGSSDNNVVKYHNDVSQQIADIENELQGIQQPINQPQVEPQQQIQPQAENSQSQNLNQSQPPNLTQPTLQTYQGELENLKQQIKAEQKKLSAAIDTKDTAAVREATANIKALQQQLTDKNAEIENYRKSPEHIQSRTAELENLKSMRDNLGEILDSGVKDKNLSRQYADLQKEILSRQKELQELQETPLYENNPAIQKIGAKYVVSGGKNPKPAIKLSEEIGGKYIAKDNNFAFDTQEAAERFLNRRGEVSDAPTGEYQSAGIYGDTTEVETTSGKEISVRYKIVPNHSLNVSHKIYDDSGVFKNKHYPQELQPRNRESQTLQAQVFEAVNNLNPRKVGESIYLNEGAPITREDGVVLNGNMRAMMIETAYDKNKAANYKKYLIDNAGKFGFNAEEVAQFESPVLVREVAEKLDAETLAEVVKSEEGGANFNPSELAKGDAEAIKYTDFGDYNPDSNGDLTAPSNRNFVNEILNRLAKSAKTQNQYRKSDGDLNGEAVNRVKRAIFALAYGNDDLTVKMAESIDDDIKNISRAAEIAAVDFAKLKLKQRSGYAEEYDVGGIVAEAMQAYEDVKHNDNYKTIEEFINQDRNRMFDPRSNAVYDVLEVFDRYKRKTQELAEFLKDIVKAADNKPNPDQVGFDFGEDYAYKKSSIDEIIRAVRNEYLPATAETERRAAEQAAREKMLAANEKTESQKIFERGEQRAREKFENKSDERFLTEQVEQPQEESAQTQSEEKSESRQEKKSAQPEKTSIYREGNKFVVNVGEDVSNLKLGLLGAFLKGTGGKYRRGTKTFEFPKASAARTFATNVEITKMNDIARQEMYRAAKVADFPILKPIFDAGYNNSQAVESLKYLQNLQSKERGLLAIQALLNTYRGDSEKLHKAENYLSKLEKGTQQERESIKTAYDKIYDMLYGSEIEDGENLPALTAPAENISEVENKTVAPKTETRVC